MDMQKPVRAAGFFFFMLKGTPFSIVNILEESRKILNKGSPSDW